jgi:parvulin-like peptidyl-prolyl isomerase
MAKQVKARHILVKDEKLAHELLDRVKNGEGFESIARSYSKCPSGQKGGNLGWFKRGQMVRPFENAAFSIKKKGLFPEVVKTEFGFHIIEVLDSK